MTAPQDQQVFKCLVIAERTGPRQWRASATVTVNGRAVAASTARGTSRSAAVGSAGAQALEVAARYHMKLVKGA